MNRPDTLIVVILDRSGSMDSIHKDMIGGFNRFIANQREDDVKNGYNTYCSLYRFNTVYEPVFVEYSIMNSDVKLDESNFVPSGGTALYDSMCQCIDETGRRLAALPEYDRPKRVVFVCITDGYENASRKHSREDVSKRINHQENVYSWQFVYLGANQDAFAVGRSIGVKTVSTMNFQADSAGTREMWAKVSESMCTYKASNPGSSYDLSSKT